jgi:hypothetical protein
VVANENYIDHIGQITSLENFVKLLGKVVHVKQGLFESVRVRTTAMAFLIDFGGVSGNEVRSFR